MDGTAPLPSRATLRRLAARAVIVRTQAADIPSPCINVCRIDPVQAICNGCFRTLDEIAAWGMADDEAKRQVWAQIAERLPALTPHGETP
ncbi:MAG: DUF1289 domain-containing protein [Rhodoferax sp.]|nr:DUF1289 domain-containing protein [Rhodoferax sp.]